MKSTKTYLTTSTQGLHIMPEIFREILITLKKTDCKNLNNYIDESLKLGSLGGYSTTKQDNQLYTKSLKLINKVDFIIADVTFASITVGRQIEYALQRGKPVLCLLNSDRANYLSSSMFDTELELQTFMSYNSKTLKAILSEFVMRYRKKKVRFNLFISPDNENFLTWQAMNNSINKSEFVRRLIEREMKRNKEYQKIF